MQIARDVSLMGSEILGNMIQIEDCRQSSTLYYRYTCSSIGVHQDEACLRL